jgi:hypothetical protein
MEAHNRGTKADDVTQHADKIQQSTVEIKWRCTSIVATDSPQGLEDPAVQHYLKFTSQELKSSTRSTCYPPSSDIAHFRTQATNKQATPIRNIFGHDQRMYLPAVPFNVSFPHHVSSPIFFHLLRLKHVFDYTAAGIPQNDPNRHAMIPPSMGVAGRFLGQHQRIRHRKPRRNRV